MKQSTNFLLNSLAAILICLVVLTMSACRKCQDPNNPSCENYDPCIGISPIKADFKILELYGLLNGSYTYKEISADTALRGGLKLVAPEFVGEFRAYEWHIGNDPRVWTTPTLSLLGSNIEGLVAIKLIVRGRPNTKCFPNEVARDTLVKNIYLINPTKVPWLQNFRFRGADDSAPLDTFEMTYYHNPNNDHDYYTNYPIKGCNPQQDIFPAASTQADDWRFTEWHKWYIMGTANPCNYETWIYGRNYKTVIVKYRKRARRRRQAHRAKI